VAQPKNSWRSCRCCCSRVPGRSVKLLQVKSRRREAGEALPTRVLGAGDAGQFEACSLYPMRHSGKFEGGPTKAGEDITADIISRICSTTELSTTRLTIEEAVSIM